MESTVLLMTTASSGIKELDKLLGGGVPQGTQILLEVETGTGPLLFIEKWLCEGVRQKKVCFLYSFDYSAETILQKFAEFGIIPKEFFKMGKIVDFWTKGEEYVRDFSKSIITIGEPTNINRVIDIIHGIWQEYRNNFETDNGSRINLVRSATYSLSTIIMTFGFDKTYKLIKELIQVAKNENAITMDIIGLGMHTSMETKTFEFLYDAVVRLEIKEVNGEFKRYLRVVKSPIFDYETKKIPYEFMKNDIVLLKPDKKEKYTF